MDNPMVWYACYGSNLLKDRFLCYIRGGAIPGNTREERGAEDKTLPAEDRPYIIDHRLFFALHPDKWNGSGVAFIDPEKSGVTTYGRAYHITMPQFLDVVRQENSLPADAKINLDIKALHEAGTQILFKDNYYGRLLYLGDLEGDPVYTFTCEQPMESFEKSPVFGGYYDVIAAGLKETYGFGDEKIRQYMTAAEEKS